jgi:outer membrane biosynthesis protein TonB
MARARTNLAPALFAAALGHVLIVAAALVSWPWLMKPVELGKVVPVTLVTNGPPADLAPAEKAPTPAPAMAPAPTPEAPPQPAPIAPAPPTPPAPSAAAKPADAAKANPSKQTPSLKAAPSSAKSANKGLDLDALMASLSSSPSKASSPQTSGQVGQNRQKAAPVEQQGQGTDDRLSANEIQALGDKLGKLWNPNCQVLGANDTNIKVKIQLTAQGYVVSKQLVNQADIKASGNPVLTAAADRALSAVGRGEPYTDVLNPEHYAAWRVLTVNFNAKQVCSKP